ncbi:MAG: hypothetical protein QOD75_421 [Blastocatellia bacterium]|jgi:PAS domain S-box-containing protein|nr:hypothetical protein [Blastocatellia bacterium]
MAIELRKTGLSVVGDVPWGTHFCHFYETKEDLLETLVPYFKAGLESNEYCLWVVSESELITVAEAKQALAQAVPDLERHLTAGNIEIRDAQDWYLEKNGFNLERVTSAWDAKLKRALTLGYEGMRVSGDTFWLRGKDWKDFCAYEKQLNDSTANRHITLICTYSLAKSSAVEILDVVEAHQFATVTRQGESKVIGNPGLLRARGEIERLNYALGRVKERTPQPSTILKWVVAVLSFSLALIITLWMRKVLGQSATPIVAMFLCAVMCSAWFGGVRPGLLAVFLSLMGIAFFFATPINSFAVDVREVPRLLVFVFSALFVGSLSAAQRNATESLRSARDVLEGTVQELKRTNDLLHARIAERKRAEALLHAKEQQFRAIVENAPDQIIRYDRDLRRVYVNPAAAEFYGLPAESLIDKPLGVGLGQAGRDVKEDEIAQVRERIAAVFYTGKSCEYELTWTGSTGPTYFSVRLFPELDLAGSVVNVMGISRDITKRKLAEEELKATSEQLRSLSAGLQSAREEEGTRIARELHDELGSALTGLRWGLDELDGILSTGAPVDTKSVSGKIAAMTTLIDGTLNTVRRIASELRPSILDDLGLTAAIEWQAQQFQARTAITCHCDCSEPSVELSQEQSTAIFRILQEALTNILRHAQATRVDIRIEKQNGYFVLSVKDNGKGINEREKLGILGMRERAHLIGGKIDIKGVAGKGTEVIVRVPVSRPGPD